jgi:acyl carrier protein
MVDQVTDRPLWRIRTTVSHSSTMNTQNSQRLQDIFRAVFELSPGIDVTQLDQTNSPRWDSLDHVSLVTAIESEFGISLDAGDQLRMASFSATSLLLEEKGL